MTFIETAHLFLRRPTSENNLVLENLWRNEKVRTFLGGIIIDDEAIKQKIIALKEHWDLHQFGQWVVYEKKSNQIAGLCGLHHSDDGVEISYMFFPSYRGKGLATEAMLASINDGFNSLKIETIIAITQKNNIKSCQLLNRIGMEYIRDFERFNAAQCLYRLSKHKTFNLTIDR